MAIIIVYEQDNKLLIITPAPEMFDSESPTRRLLSSNGIELESQQEVLSWIIHKDAPQHVAYYITDDSKLPQSRIWRDAWTYNQEADLFGVDISQAIAIRKTILQGIRPSVLSELMNRYLMALGTGDITLKEALELQINALNSFESLDFPSDLDVLANYLPDCFNIV